MLIGNKEVIAFQLGQAEPESPDLRTIQLWLGGIDVTSQDSWAYLPAFLAALERDLASFEATAQRQHKKVHSLGDAKKYLFPRLSAQAIRYNMLALGETTDDLRAFGFTAKDLTFIAFQLRPSSKRRGVALPTRELRGIIEQTIAMARFA